MREYENMRTADIVAEELLDWKVDTIFGLPGDGINGFIEALRRRQDKIKFILVRHEESAAFMACAYAKYTGKLGACVATSGPGAIHLLNGLYDAKLDNTPVIAITGSTYSDLMNSSYQQDVNLLQLFSDVSVYNNIINRPEHTEMAVDIACRTALTQRGVSHLTIPIDVQEMELKGKYSRHKVAGHTSDVYTNLTMPDKQLIQKAADILNSGKKVVILSGQGALNAGDELAAVAERLGAPIVKALLGKAVIPDDHPHNLGGLGLLGTEPASDAMSGWRDLLKERSSRNDKPIKPDVIAMAVSDELEDNAIISADSGANTTSAARYINIRKGMKFSVSGTLASMACGLPYAIAAQIAFPERQSIAFVGDGGFTMLMGEFATAVQYNLPIKVIIIKNNTLGMIRWEQLAFLGNAEYGVEFTPINYASFAEACGGKGYVLKEPDEAKPIISKALKEKKPTIVEVYTDPFEPPMPPKVESEFIVNLAESFAKGQPYRKRIGLTLFRNQVHEVLKNIHSHDVK